MHDSWSCVLVENGPSLVDKTTMQAIKMAACRLFLAKRDRLLFDAEACAGIIVTDWDVKRIGAISGILFKAELSLAEYEEYPDYRVNFLIKEADLDRGAKLLQKGEEDEMDHVPATTTYRFPIDELYRFDNLSPSRMRH